MTAPVAIEVSALGKKFCPAFRRSLAYGALDIAAKLLPTRAGRARLRKGEFWALQDISFTLRRGEALAVIGHNGAGKSTLLKILYGLLEADAGIARSEGRVIALIELGAGINPLLTGRENIMLVAALHGLSRKQALAIVPEVLDFAELEAAADVAVRSYSSGMRARLSYAIAAMLRPAVFLVDEVLAVGDLAFQRKCIAHLQRYLAQGGTLVLVSHAPHHVQAICSRAILLDHGKLVAEGDVAQVIRTYLDLRPSVPAVQPASDEHAMVSVGEVAVRHENGDAPRSGQPAVVQIRGEAKVPIHAYCGFAISSQDGWTCITSSFATVGTAMRAGPVTMECRIANLPMVAGRYLIRPILADCLAHAAVPLTGPGAAGVLFDVAGRVDMFSNGELQMGQLVAIDGDWGTPPTPIEQDLAGSMA